MRGPKPKPGDVIPDPGNMPPPVKPPENRHIIKFEMKNIVGISIAISFVLMTLAQAIRVVLEAIGE